MDDIMQQLSLYDTNRLGSRLYDCIWNWKATLGRFDSNMKQLLKQFCIPLIPSNIPDIGGISKDLINNKEYFLYPPMKYVTSLKEPLSPKSDFPETYFFPHSEYESEGGAYFQPIDIIRMGYKNYVLSATTVTDDQPDSSLINFNVQNIGIFSSNLLRLKLVIKDENNKDIKAQFNQTYFTDESTAKFFMHYDTTSRS